MAKIVGMNGGQQPPQQPKIDLKDAKEMTCQNCGGSVFIPAKDAIIPVELYLCGDCGEICKELLPDELKPVITDLDG